MFNGYFEVALADEDLTRPVPWSETLARAARGTFRPRFAGMTVLAGGLFLAWGRLRRRARGQPVNRPHGD